MIRKVTVDDLDDLRRIAMQTFDEAFRKDNKPEHMDAYLSTSFTEDKVRSELENEHSYFYFIYSGGTLSGYLKLNTDDAQTEDMGSDYLEIERIYILNTYQKLGLGGQLYQFAVDFASDRGMNKIWLGVWEKNKNAIEFYERYGFKKVDSHAFYMGDDRQIDWIMVKEL